MLSTLRRRHLPAALIVSGALAVGLAGTTVPAQASSVTATSISASTTTGTSAVVTAAVAPTAVQAAAVRAAAARAARATAVRRAKAARAAHVLRVRSSAVHIARTKLGDRYSAGHAGPNRFDCSGLAMYVVKHALGRSLPHYSRSQWAVTKRVSRKNLRPGDLVFFFRHGAHHVGIYIGGGRMISATNPRRGVKVDSVFSGWYGSRYSGAGRLI